MAECKACNKLGPFLRVNENGLCKDCEEAGVEKPDEAGHVERVVTKEGYAPQNVETSPMVTTGFSFDGYRVQRYCGIVYGKKIFSDLLLFQEKEKNENELDNALSNAVQSMMKKASQKGANAIIGVDTEFHDTGTSVLGQRMIACILSGTAVSIAPEIESDE